jgi:hypothetical protein
MTDHGHPSLTAEAEPRVLEHGHANRYPVDGGSMIGVMPSHFRT